MIVWREQTTLNLSSQNENFPFEEIICIMAIMSNCKKLVGCQ